MAMSPKEIADRLRQQATARWDFLRYKAGGNFGGSFDLKGSGRRDPRFFFSSDSIPRLCARLRERLPKETDQIIERAERICQHRFDLLGYRDLDYGTEIDWHLDRVHGKQSPRKPWFKIHYLDFAEVGDIKVTWELNRHQHLVTLAKAFRLTGDEKYSAELFRQWKHWHRENPYPIGVNWSSSLEVAFRSLSWLWLYFLMAGSDAEPGEFRSEFYASLAVSGRHIEKYLSTYFSPNTHLLGEGAALFFIGTSCPELPRAEQWQARGWKILQDAAERQVRGDGLHFEQSIYYHVYALDFFLHAMVLASRNGIDVPVQFERTVERMLEALCVLGRSGPVPRLGDDDGGRVFDGQRNRWSEDHLLDPLAAGAVLFGREDFKSVASQPREEMIWLLGDSGLTEFDRLPKVAVTRGSSAFPDSGLYVMSSDDLGQQLVIDAGPQGADTAGHGHADALSITANSAGRALLVDPGTFEYVGESLERNRFRGTKAHNTLAVDGLDQAEPKGPFGWGRLPNVRAEEWIAGENFDYFVGSHDGFTRLADPVVHRRLVFSLKSRFWLVRDQALGLGKHQLELFWHINPELLPIESNRAAFGGADVGLSIVTLDGNGWTQEVQSEDWSPAYGQKERYSVVRLGAAATLPAELISLLVPHVKGRSTGGSFARVKSSSTGESVVCYRFKTAEEEHHFVFGQGSPWTLFQWSSDANFLYWGLSQDKTCRLFVCCNASYVEAGGRKIMSFPRKVARCEAAWVDGKMNVTSSDPGAVVDDEALQHDFL
jgi:Heparinase II/III-like protein/Heparinase II/III N-terminus